MKSSIPSLVLFTLLGGNVVRGTPVIQERLLVSSLSDPIDVSGDHKFKAPDFSAGDQRGPCPGLNALANHGYIPHNGITSLIEAITAINEVYGMSVELATALAVMGTVWVGNPLSLDPGFSIGGNTSASDNILGNVFGLVGTPRGLDGSHNFIEGDSSNTRSDIYLTGDAHTLQMDQFMEWYNMSEDGTYNMSVMAERANIRFEETMAKNPNFYYGPFTGLIARNAGYVFVGRLLANHSTEHPEGLLTSEVMKSFHAISGEEGNFTYNEGWESIPENWYKRPVDYTLVDLNIDIVSMVLQYPQLGSVGGNTGTVNSFTGIDLGNLTGGVFNAANLLNGNNLLCLAFEVVKTVAPNTLTGVFSTLNAPLEFLLKALQTPLLDLSCPAWNDIADGPSLTDKLATAYPGATSGGGL